MLFTLTDTRIDCVQYRQQLPDNAACGAVCTFEGHVRRLNDNKQVDYLIYSAYHDLAINQGQLILQEAKKRFAIEDALCVHRIGNLAINDVAIYIAVAAAHRDPAFTACRFILDRVKEEVPIWKQEFYLDSDSPAWLANTPTT